MADIFDPTDYAARLYARRAEAVACEDDFAGLDGWKPTPQDCHDNVDYLVERVPGAMVVRGWMVADYGDEFGFIAHSIVRLADGRNINVTPPGYPLPWRYPFLEDHSPMFAQAMAYTLAQPARMLKHRLR